MSVKRTLIKLTFLSNHAPVVGLWLFVFVHIKSLHVICSISIWMCTQKRKLLFIEKGEDLRKLP